MVNEKNKKWKMLNIRIPSEMYEGLRSESYQSRRSVTEIVRQAIERRDEPYPTCDEEEEDEEEIELSEEDYCDGSDEIIDDMDFAARLLIAAEEQEKAEKEAEKEIGRDECVLCDRLMTHEVFAVHGCVGVCAFHRLSYEVERRKNVNNPSLDRPLYQSLIDCA